MTQPQTSSCTAFAGADLLAQGALPDVALAVKAALARQPEAAVLTFDDATGRVVDFDLRGSDAEIIARLPAAPSADAAETDISSRGPGRPKLGVIAREVTLLPRHWKWLSAQRGGASHALRRLVDEARRVDGGKSDARQRRDAAYRFMSAMAGNRPGFEEASRALFADDRPRFEEMSAEWPADIRDHVLKLAWLAA